MRQDPDELVTRIDITPDFAALCRRLDANAARSRMRALAKLAEDYEAQTRVRELVTAA